MIESHSTPFLVYNHPVPKSFYHQPIELIEHTITWIDHRDDLLSLALTAKLFCRLIIPHHIQLRHIRCHPNNDSVWKSFIGCPAWAAGVRRLELIDDRTELRPLVPTSLIRTSSTAREVTDTNLNIDSVELLSKTIKHMVNLKHFAWTESAPISSALQNLFDELATQHNLTEFGFGVDMVGIHHLASNLRLPSDIFRELTSFAWNAHLTPLCVSEGVTDLLREAPMLENLYLGLRGNCSKYQILEEGHWPRLRRLTILNAVHLFKLQPFENIEDNSRLLGMFLARHRKLECLSISGDDFEPQLVFTGSFPNLRSLSLSLCSGCDGHLSFPLEILGRLENFDHPIHPEHIIMLKSMSLLRGCSIQWRPNVLRSAVTNICQVKRLCLRPSLSSKEKGKNLIPFLEHELSSLFELRELTHLGGFMTFDELDLLHCQEALSFLQKLCRIRHLKYVEVILGGHSTWVELERVHGEYVGYHHSCHKHNITEYYLGGI